VIIFSWRPTAYPGLFVDPLHVPFIFA
jgi:hypothetical protein